MKKNKLRKKILILSTFGIASAFSVCTGVGLLNVSISNTNTNKDIKKVGTSLNALDTTTSSSNQTSATFNVTQPTTILNKTADKVLNSDIEAILTPSSPITNFSVVILPVTQKNINEGYVNFLVFETYWANSKYTTELADAKDYKSDDTIDSTTLSKYANSSSGSKDNKTVTAEAKNVFSTKKIANLSSIGVNKERWITPEKYTLSWASDDYLKQYITSKTTELTAEDVWNNFFSENNYLPPLKSSTNSKDSSANSDQYTQINVSKVDASGNTSSNDTGIYKVEISIYNTTKDSWTSEPSTTPSTYTITKYFGGFLKSDGTRDNISINVEQSIGSWNIPNLSTFYYGSTQINKPLNSLAASEFINPVGGTSTLISMFDSGMGLKKPSSDTNSTPIITYKFNANTYNFYNSNNSNSSNDSNNNGNSGGILGEIQKNKQKIKITNIQAIPDDSTGSLKLIFYYDGYSIYSDSVVSQIYTYTYPAGTFAVSLNPDQNSIFTWKNVNTLSDDGLSTSYDIVNEFNKNKDNAEFVRLFTNQFLDASSDILDMTRTAIITYGTDTTNISDPTISPSTNDYSSDTSSPSICIQLTFDNWSKQEKTKIFTTSYTFSNYKYTYSSNSNSNSTDDSLTLSWKTSSNVIKENPSYAATSPSEIVYNLLSNSNISNSYTKFFTGTSLNSSQLAVSYLPDNTNGTILVYVSRRTDQNSGSSNSSISQLNAHVYSQLFVGFKKSASSGGIMSYSWLPQDDISLELLSIPLSRVTKADVMKYYLDNISLFKDRTLTEDDVEIIPDISSSSLTVKVTINDFNKDNISITSSNQTFLTKITGFVSSTHTNDTVFSPPKNLTAVISVSAATLISVTLGIVLCGMLIRRARIRDFKGYHGSVLNGDKQKKESKNKKKKII